MVGMANSSSETTKIQKQMASKDMSALSTGRRRPAELDALLDAGLLYVLRVNAEFSKAILAHHNATE